MSEVVKIENGSFFENGLKLGPFSISINKGEICELTASDDVCAALFLRGMATMAKMKGRFYFKEKKYNTENFKSLLEVKRRVAYLGSLCALMSSRSLLENIYLGELWEKNLDEIIVEKSIAEEFKSAGIEEFLHMKPGEVPDEIQCGTFIVRELKKKPDLILLERPYLFTRGRLNTYLREKIKDLYEHEIPIIFTSSSGFIPDREVTHVIKINYNSVEKTAR